MSEPPVKGKPKPIFIEEPEEEVRPASKLATVVDRENDNAAKRIIRNMTAATKTEDPRWELELDLMPNLEKKYAKEFKVADELMLKKKAEYDASWLSRQINGDPDVEKLYEEYSRDMDEMHELLKIHPIDDALDHTWSLMKYVGRVGTAVGFMYGVGRTGYLWKSMDKNYAKLNGVRLIDIAMYECSVGICGGMFLSVMGAVGAVVGEQYYGFVDMWQNNSIHKPPRSWKSITAAGFAGGLHGGMWAAMLFRRTLSNGSLGMMTLAPAIVGTAGAYYVGANIYQPFADRRGRGHDENPRARPWYEQQMIAESNKRHLRGRFS